MSRTPAVHPADWPTHENVSFAAGASGSGATGQSTRPATIDATPVTGRTAPLRLSVAARLAFPDGSMSDSALRRLIVSGQLEAEFIAGKYYVTLAAIEEMRGRCRVNRKDQDLPSTVEGTGLSATEEKTVALDAMNMTAKLLRQNLQNTSSRSMTRKRPSAKVNPMPSK